MNSLDQVHKEHVRRSEGIALKRQLFQSPFYGGLFALSTSKLIKLNFHVSLPQRRSSTVCLETNHFIHLPRDSRKAVNYLYLF